MVTQPHSLPPPNGFHPASFGERGLAAPFTSPVLAGARLRRAKDFAAASTNARAPGNVLDVIVPNWAGGKGVYIVSWPAARELFRPTVHDIRLGEALVQSVHLAGDLHPAELRRLTREAARDGLAGRAAAAAAAAAIVRADTRNVESFVILLRELARQLGLALFAQAGTGATLAAAAHRLDRPEAALAATLRELAPHFAEAGLAEASAAAPIPQLIALVRSLQGGAGHPGLAAGGPGAAALAHVGAHAKLMVVLADKAVGMVRARANALPALVTAASAQRADTMAHLERPSWIVDGWEPIALLLRTTPAGAGRAAVLAEAAALVPALPDELDRWLDFPAGTAARASAGSRPGLAGPAAASTLDAVARNEHIRMLAA